MIIRKSILCLAEIESFVDPWVISIVGDFENGGKASDEHVGQLFEISLKNDCWKGSKQYYDLCKRLNVCKKYQGISFNLKLG